MLLEGPAVTALPGPACCVTSLRHRSAAAACMLLHAPPPVHFTPATSDTIWVHVGAIPQWEASRYREVFIIEQG